MLEEAPGEDEHDEEVEEEHMAMGRVLSRAEALELVESELVAFVHKLGEGFCEVLGKSMGQDARLFMRTVSVLNLVHALLVENRQVSQRDVYYQLVALFASARECNWTIASICKSLKVARISLNIYAASRGFVVGAMKMLDDTGHWINLTTLGRDGRTINGNMSDLQRPIQAPSARFILVIEKEGVYQELADARLYNQIPCIMVTAHGIPDVATRAFVSRLSSELKIPALCLADWNPGGVQVMITYRWGSLKKKSLAAEGKNFECSNFGWLGVHAADVADLDAEHRVPFSIRDEHRLNNLKQHVREAADGNYLNLTTQLNLMEDLGVRVELQAFRSDGFSLVEYVMRKLVRRQWLEI